jgi:hypothetical protein
MTTLARLRTALSIVLWQYLGLVPIAALLALLAMVHAARLAGVIWFALILIPPYLGALAMRESGPPSSAVHPLALALGSAGGCAAGLWLGQDRPDDASVLLLEIAGSLVGVLLMTFWPVPARRSFSRPAAKSTWAVAGLPATARASSWPIRARRAAALSRAERWGV